MKISIQQYRRLLVERSFKRSCRGWTGDGVGQVLSGRSYRQEQSVP